MDELTLKAEAEKLLEGVAVLQAKDEEIARLKARLKQVTIERDDLKAENAHIEAVARQEGWDPDQTNATHAQWLIHRARGEFRPGPKGVPEARHVFEEGGIDALKAAYTDLKEKLEAKSSGEEEERILLWAHIVSKHAAILDPDTPMEDLTDLHEHEHDGPGTIRDHDRKLRTFNLKRLGQVLSEADDEDSGL